MTSLAQAVAQYGAQAYLVTVSPDGPHTGHVVVALEGKALGFAIGNTARRNAQSNANVSLLWPPAEAGGYSLVVNGLLECDAAPSERATLAVSKAVLHRPGPPSIPGGACSSDCQPLEWD